MKQQHAVLKPVADRSCLFQKIITGKFQKIITGKKKFDFFQVPKLGSWRLPKN